MRRLLSCWWAGSCLLAALAACGCRNCQPCCSCSPASAACSSPSKRTCWSDNFSWSNQAIRGTTAAARKDASVAAPAGSAVTEYMLTDAAKISSPAAAAYSLASDSRRSLKRSPYSATTSVAGQEEQSFHAPYPNATVVVTSNGIGSSEPRYGHDANYHSLIGILDYSRIQQAWVLRYVSYEDDDRYGGCVTLVVPSSPMRFKPGQTVRVEGELIDPESRQLRPAFQVQKIQAAGS